ncbi:MAG: hypothetical protein ABIQ89_03540 [Candidatus Saccharimonadales bacterium]
MRKKLLIIGAFVAGGLTLLVSFLAFYFFSSTASQAQLETEAKRLQVNSTSVKLNIYQSGSCFDRCATAGFEAMIPKTSDYITLFDNYKQKLSDNGYTVSTTQEEFLSPAYSNGNPSGRYLLIHAEGKNKYQVNIMFQDNQTGQPDYIKPSGQPVSSVDRAYYSISANTR